MAEERCENCGFWNRVLREIPPGTPTDVPFVPRDGECRFNAPGAYHQHSVSEPLGNGGFFTLKLIETPFPPMHAEEWCGKWQPSLEKKEKTMNNKYRRCKTMTDLKFILQQIPGDLPLNFPDGLMPVVLNFGSSAKGKRGEQLIFVQDPSEDDDF